MLFNILSFVCNLVMLVCTAGSIIHFYTKGGSANMKVKNEKCFEYFTVDSNVLVSLAGAVMMVFNVIGFVKGEFLAPYWALVLKLVGTVAVTLTFVVVLTMLAPSAKDGFFSLFEGPGFFMHFTTPVLAMLSFILFERGTKLSYLMILFALIPTVVYAIVYFTKVIIIGEKNGGWEDFYGFNKGGKWYITAPVIVAMTAIIAFVMILLHNLAS